MLIGVQAYGTSPPAPWPNSLNALTAQPGFLLEAFPSILGADFAGVVDEVGEGVTRLWKGQRVMG